MPDRPRPGLRFSRVELVQLGIAILALALAMTVLFIRAPAVDFFLGGRIGAAAFATLFGLYLAMSLVAVSTGVGIHEIAHKAVAQRYGHWAEFRYNPMGLMLAFVFAFMGFLYGAPGATYISGYVTPEQNGRISAAGPTTNILLGSGFLGLAALLGTADASDGWFLVRAILQAAAFINLVLAGFNMIPLMPLDGAKVWAWNKGAYAGIVGIVVVLIVAGWRAGLLMI
jgi:Zn-dependent protease